MHLTSSPVDWYAARAAGLTAYLLLSGVVLLGLTMAAKKPFARWPRFTLEDVHRFGGLLVGSLRRDPRGHGRRRLLAAVLARLSRRAVHLPLSAALGRPRLAAAELLSRSPSPTTTAGGCLTRSWRRAHYLNFAVWGAATVHGIGSGTDRSAPWALAVYAAASPRCRPRSSGASRTAAGSGRPRRAACRSLRALLVVGLGRAAPVQATLECRELHRARSPVASPS